MSFIKRGDVKIVKILTEEDLTEEQKKASHDLSHKVEDPTDDVPKVKKGVN